MRHWFLPPLIAVGLILTVGLAVAGISQSQYPRRQSHRPANAPARSVTRTPRTVATTGGVQMVAKRIGKGTALAPEIGYDRAAELVKEAYHSGATVREVASRKSGIAAEKLESLLDPARQAGP